MIENAVSQCLKLDRINEDGYMTVRRLITPPTHGNVARIRLTGDWMKLLILAPEIYRQ